MKPHLHNYHDPSLTCHYARAVGHVTLPTKNIYRKLICGVWYEQLSGLDQRILDGVTAMFCVTVFDQEIVNCFRNFRCSVKPPNNHNEGISLALLELSDIANIVGLVRTLTFDEDVVTHFVFYWVIVTSVSQKFSLLISPRFTVRMFLSPNYCLFNIFFVNITWYRTTILKMSTCDQCLESIQNLTSNGSDDVSEFWSESFFFGLVQEARISLTSLLLSSSEAAIFTIYDWADGNLCQYYISVIDICKE